jgi:hypothetical protein
MGLPLGHVPIHQIHEARVVRRFEEVNHLVNDNVLKAFPRLSGEVRIQSDGPGAVVAATPFRLHSLNEKSPHPYTHQPFPFVDQWRDGFPQLLAMPFLDDGLPLQ